MQCVILSSTVEHRSELRVPMDPQRLRRSGLTRRAIYAIGRVALLLDRDHRWRTTVATAVLRIMEGQIDETSQASEILLDRDCLLCAPRLVSRCLREQLARAYFEGDHCFPARYCAHA